MESLAESMPGHAAMPRFEDGSINLQGADEAPRRGRGQRHNGRRGRPAVRGRRQQPQRLPRAQPGHVRGRYHAAHTQAEDRAASSPRTSSSATSASTAPLVAAVAEMYATGTSTRKVQRVAEKLGVSRLSKDQVSAHSCRTWTPTSPSFVGRDLDGSRGARTCGSTPPTSSAAATGRVASTAVVTAIGCDEGGWRRVLGVAVVDTESYDSWARVPARHQGPRRPRRPSSSISDAHKGLIRAIEEVFQGAVVAALRRAPDARLHARGGIAARSRGAWGA